MAGIALAGLAGGDSGPVSKDRGSIAESKTAQGSVIQVLGGVGTGWLAMFRLEGPALYFALGLSTVVVIAALVIFRERLLKWADGVR
jgi:hypothetical protein